MSTVTITNAENALKSFYLDVVAHQLNMESNPFYAMIKQSESCVYGKEVRKAAIYGVNGGISAGSEAGDLPGATGNNYAQFVSTLKNLYGSIQISDKAIRAGESSAGAFVNLLNAEMDGLLRSAKFNFSRMLYGDGSGKLCTISADASNAKKIGVDSARNLAAGMVVDIYSSISDGTPAVSGVTITGIEKTASGTSVHLDRKKESVKPDLCLFKRGQGRGSDGGGSGGEWVHICRQ